MQSYIEYSVNPFLVEYSKPNGEKFLFGKLFQAKRR